MTCCGCYFMFHLELNMGRSNITILYNVPSGTLGLIFTILRTYGTKNQGCKHFSTNIMFLTEQFATRFITTADAIFQYIEIK